MIVTLLSRPILAVVAAAVLLGPIGVVGCQKTSPPRRVPPGETTAGELNDPRQHPVTLVEFQDTATADMLQMLPDAPRVRDVAGSATILMGDINNKTSLVSTADYEYITSGVRSRLIRARATRDKLKFVEKRRRVENIAARERVATDPAPPAAGSEEINWGGGSYYVPDYKADESFGLMMDVYRINRGNTNLYSVEIQLVHFATGEIVYSYKQDVKQVGP